MLQRRLLSILLALALMITMLGGTSVVLATDTTGSTASADLNVIYIPLDNRPFNCSEVCTYAKSIGIHLIMPDEALFATTLDGQSSTTGLQCGDRAALIEWLMENADQADIMILSLDQLLSGGLMNSRVIEDTGSFTLSDGTVMDEYAIIDYLATLTSDHEIYFLDSELRLASSYGYAGYTLLDYKITRAYGMVCRPELTGDELTPENILAGYRLSADGASALSETEGLTDYQIRYFLGSADTDSVSDSFNTEAEHSRLQRYLNIRERKLRLNAYAIQTLAGLRNTHYYLGIDDSSPGYNLQTNEISYLEQLACGNVNVIDTLDGIVQLLLTTITANILDASLPTAQIFWYGESADNDQSFSRITIRQSLQDTATQLGIELVSTGADLSVLALTECEDSVASNAAVYQLVSQLNQNEAAGIPTILIFFTSCTAVQKQILAETCHMGFLLAVAGNYEPSNATMGLSMGLGRYLMLTAGSLSDARNLAHIENLAESLMYVCYGSSSQRNDMSALISSLGLDYTNFGELSAGQEAQLSASLTQKAYMSAADILTSIAGSNYIVSLHPYKTAGLKSVELTSACYPLNRAFEVEYTMQIQLNADSTDSGTLQSSFVSGVSATRFAPTATATREQLVVMLTRVAGISLSKSSMQYFSDVSEYASTAVQTAVDTGLVHGYDDGTFRGTKAMTRAEFCTMLVNYLNYAGRELPQNCDTVFTDVPETGKWYSENVYALARAGYISGYEEGTFCPDQTITRAEAVTLLCRIFGRTEILSDSFATVARFRDVSTDYWAFPYIQQASVSHFSVN